MADADVVEPFGDGKMWVVRVQAGLMVCGAAGMSWVEGDLQWLVFVPLVAMLWCGFEWFVAARRRIRAEVLRTGAWVEGTVVSRRATRRSALSKVRLRYEWEGKRYESEQYVSDRLYFRVQVGQALEVRVSERMPWVWVPAQGGGRPL